MSSTNVNDVRQQRPVFHVSIPHNIVQLLFGMVGLVMARTLNGARGFLIGGSAADFVPLNTADNRLHLMLGWGSSVSVLS